MTAAAAGAAAPLAMEYMQQASGMLPSVIGGVVAAIPGKQEKAMREQLRRDEARLASGRGLSAGQRAEYQGQAMQGINAQQQQVLAQFARGAVTPAGQSGLQQQAQANILRGGQDAARSVASDVNRLDRQVLEALKADVQAQRANMMNINASNAQAIATGAGALLTGMGPAAKAMGLSKSADQGTGVKTTAAQNYLAMTDDDPAAAQNSTATLGWGDI